MSYVRFIVSVAAVVAATLCQGADRAERSRTAVQNLRAARAGLGLDPQTDFTVKDVLEDTLGHTHVRLQQTYRGLPVWGGQAIVHLGASGEELPMTDALVRGLQLEVSPNLGAGEALAVAQDRIAPKGSYSDPPGADLVVWPEAGDGGVPLRQHLAYHLHAELENGPEETRHEEVLVDAQTGAVLKAWSSLLTSRRHRRAPRPEKGTPATGVGNSQYSGQVALGTLALADGFELTDPTRGGFTTRNLGGLSSGPGQPYRNAQDQWGDGQNYDPGRGPASPNGQTAAVDAHYGLQVAWDFYKNILGRDGIDGRGTAAMGLVHYARNYNNAFWSDGCFCMTFGDGPATGPLTALDVVGHEVSHGLCSTTAGLDYDGESGGLNEANSDIFGALMGFYAKGAGGSGNRVPDEGGSWALGATTLGQAYRFMDKPSLDGLSPDAWSPDLKRLDVHLSSGPMNRAFYFLAQGASSDPRSTAFSPRLPRGMKGVGNDKALRIWWRTLSTRLTPTSGYREACAGALESARELYGGNSPEARAVASAFLGINVRPRRR